MKTKTKVQLIILGLIVAIYTYGYFEWYILEFLNRSFWLQYQGSIIRLFVGYALVFLALILAITFILIDLFWKEENLKSQ